ncbi:hypothetical protein AN639_12305 [Candidatus Epulonipiscium fishelsonii]|nr:hypothetical protein AN639_12305 [Epulopiscium sp. SCG-B05WGA-EpuloA1]
MNESTKLSLLSGIVNVNLYTTHLQCNWRYGLKHFHLKARNYEGDLSVEAQYMTAVTGENWSKEKLLMMRQKKISNY